MTTVPGFQQPAWWYQYTPVPNNSGGWAYTFTATPAVPPETEHASVRDIPGWERTPKTAAGLLEADNRVGWTHLTDGSDTGIVMDAEGKLYVWKHTGLTPHCTADADWGVQLTSYQGTSDSPVQIAAYIPKEASACLRTLGVHTWLKPQGEYLKIGKVLGKPVAQ